MVTRPRARSTSFADLLAARGARVILFPTIRIRPLDDPASLREALGRGGHYHWLVFTSVMGVESVKALAEDMEDPAALRDVHVAAIGPATARAVRRELGLAVDVSPTEYRAEALAAALLDAEPNPERARILLPRAAEAREVLPRLLEEAGAEVDEIPAYRTVTADAERAGRLRDRLDAGEVDWVTFTASSTVRGFADALGADAGRARVAAIGPITAETAEELGLRVDVVAREYTIPGLVDALVRAETTDRTEGGHV